MGCGWAGGEREDWWERVGRGGGRRRTRRGRRLLLGTGSPALPSALESRPFLLASADTQKTAGAPAATTAIGCQQSAVMQRRHVRRTTGSAKLVSGLGLACGSVLRHKAFCGTRLRWHPKRVVATGDGVALVKQRVAEGSGQSARHLRRRRGLSCQVAALVGLVPAPAQRDEQLRGSGRKAAVARTGTAAEGASPSRSWVFQLTPTWHEPKWSPTAAVL